MAFQPAPHCVEIIIHGTVADQEVVNTFYGKYPGAYTQANLDALASGVDVWVGEDWLPLQGAQYSYVDTTVRGLSSSIDLISVNNDHAGAGTAGSDCVSNDVSLSVKRASAFTGRGARGRVYMPPLAAGNMSDANHVSDAFVTAVETALNAFADILTGETVVEVILHRVAAGVPLAEAVAFTVVQYIVVDKVIDSMRRRLPGRGS
jgi:hypothetical protein